MKKYILSDKIKEKILTDNEFSMALALNLKKKQDTIFRLVKRESDILRLPETIDFYKEHGYTYAEIFDIVEEKPVE